ncbi:MAG: hypothetical protein ACRC6T_06905 [Sarcina sp.]
MKEVKYIEKMKDEKKLNEVSRLVSTREKELLNFYNKNEHKKDHVVYQRDNIVEDKYIVLINPNTESEELYNCFSTEQGAKDAYKRVKEENKVIAKASITYKMILGVIFVDSYKVDEYIEFAN